MSYMETFQDASPKMLENYCELIVDKKKGINALLINYTFLKK